MKIACKTRKFDTPQTTIKGKILKNIEGEPVYTEYLVLSSNKYQDVCHHMRKELNKVLEAIEAVGVSEFENITGIKLNQKSQIDNEPVPYTFMERVDMVYARINDKGKDITSGIVDQFNHVVGKTQRAIGSDNAYIEKCRINIVDPDSQRIGNILNPDLFEIGDR